MFYYMRHLAHVRFIAVATILSYVSYHLFITSAINVYDKVIVNICLQYNLFLLVASEKIELGSPYF